MHAFSDSFSQYTIPEDILILAVSGGVDSMVMLDLILANHPKENIVVVHFDHSLRRGESDGDRVFIANYCEKRNITFEVEKMDIISLARIEKMSIEMAARKYRYIFLEEVAQKYGAKYILTAHHLDDRIETAMFNLIRGTKLGGIHALQKINPLSITNHQSPITILRPLLQLPKSAILEYAREHQIHYREDSTNTDTTYLRNHLRHEVLPLFAQINPEYRRAIEHYIEYTEELKSWIDSEVRCFLGDDQRFSIPDFQEKSPFFQKEIVRYLYEVTNKGTIGLSEGLIKELIRFITEGSNSYGIREVKKLRLERRGEWVMII